MHIGRRVLDSAQWERLPQGPLFCSTAGCGSEYDILNNVAPHVAHVQRRIDFSHVIQDLITVGPRMVSKSYFVSLAVLTMRIETSLEC